MTWDDVMTVLSAVWFTIKIVWFLVAAYLMARVVIGVVRFVQASPAGRRNYWLRFRIWVTWRRLTLALGLAHIRKEVVRTASRKSIGATLLDAVTGSGAAVGVVAAVLQAAGINAFSDAIGSTKRRRRVRYARVKKVQVDDFGVALTVRTLPNIGRTEWEKAAEHLANEWRCAKVQVFQREPGRLVVRAVRRDPLAAPLAMADLPATIYTEPHPFRPYLGRDEWGVDRWIDLSGITGVTLAGLARYGKTDLVISLLMQMAGTRSVQFVILDGKGSGTRVGADYEDWVDRAWMASGDDLDRAEEILQRLNDHMMERGRVIRSVLGVKNGWHVGPSDEWPLIVLIVDECHTFFDEKQARSPEEKKQRLRIQSLAADLPRKSGSVMMLSIFLTQKQTGDAIPTAIRDNCTIGMSFAVKTRDAAVAALGESIREWPGLCPTGLRERPTYIGVVTAALPDAADLFVRLRIPHVGQAPAEQRAWQVADFVTDPDELLAAMTVRADRELEPA